MTVEIKRSPNFQRNLQTRRPPRDTEPCVVCGKTITGKAKMVHLHMGGLVAVTDLEAEALEAQGRGGEDMGWYPIGADCLRNQPELKSYVQQW
jgi:hypothetical protein